MIELRRAVRFAVPLAPPRDPGSSSAPIGIDPPKADTNGYAGVPAMHALGAHYELLVACRGTPDPATGYFMDIKLIDRAVRAHAVPRIAAAVHAVAHPGPNSAAPHDPADVLATIIAPLNQALHGTLAWARWMLTPTYGVQMSVSPNAASPVAAIISQRFEIAAAHRLHTPSLTDEQNRAFFGKCNNPSGHGHNYIIEPRVRVPVGPAASTTSASTSASSSVPTVPRFGLAQLEHAVDAAIIQPFDHKHLNLDTPEFGPDGLNPSVENISMVFFRRLAPVIAAASAGTAALQSITVFETEKTSSTYPADTAAAH